MTKLRLHQGSSIIISTCLFIPKGFYPNSSNNSLFQQRRLALATKG